MFSSKKLAILASAALVGFGTLPLVSATTLIESNQSAQVDGWNISAPTNVSLTVTSSGNEIFVEKAANFTTPNQGFQVGFQPISGAAGAATSIDFTDEAIQNNTGSAFNGFQFILLNTGAADATFPNVSNVFAPPSGTGYHYTSVTLNAAGDTLTYAGNQDAGTTSLWGSAAAGDNLLIDAPAGSAFSLKELSQSGGGGTTVPTPTAAWQSVAGLTALGLLCVGRRIKRRPAQCFDR